MLLCAGSRGQPFVASPVPVYFAAGLLDVYARAFFRDEEVFFGFLDTAWSCTFGRLLRWWRLRR